MKPETEIRVKKVKKLYEAGASIEEIASATGYKKSSVGAALRKAGIYRKTLIADNLDILLKMRREGKSLKEMSQITGFTVNTISTTLKKEGAKMYTDHGIEREIDLSNLTYAKQPKIERIVIDGKTYQDITAFFT